MKFQAGQRRKAIEYEKDLVKHWKENKTFEKSVENRPIENGYVFYDGPPFITGVPHHGTLLSSIAKDVVPRYWTMKGKRVERVWGWDCHGLPAEVFTEKKLGIRDRRDIGTKISLEEYILTCRENMVQTGDLWESTIDRVGRWVDFKGAYRTMDKDFMESVWWAFKKLYDDGKIYEGEKVLLYCTRDATPLSKAEVTMDAGSYKDVTDPSVYVKFKLKGYRRAELDSASPSESKSDLQEEGIPKQVRDDAGDESVYLLAWTTTPWTLPANTAVGVGEDETYAEVKMANGEHLILHEELVEKVLTDEKHQPVEYEIVRKDIKGSELIGKEYEPLFENRGENAHKVWNYPGLDKAEGTGIVHLAPAYGEEDYALAKENNFPFVSVVDDNGFYSEGDWKGQNVWEANKPIAKELHERGIVWKIEYVVHSYPHCYRCGTRLMYRAHPSWFMDINGQRQLMLEQNENVNWFPAHLKHGRFAKTVETAPDWNLSRDRFWATAMPVWKGKDTDGNELIKVVGSYAELKELSGEELEDYHRPWVDDIEFDFEGVHYKRIDKVMDCWFESGSMPFAQFHYPFENVEKFEANYPGDFIVEYIGQVRAWFYYVHTVNVGLFGKNAYKQVNVTGNLAGNDGRKMSKSYGNYTDPNELMDLYSADALRFLLMSSPLMNGEDFALQDKDVLDVQRKLAMIWNMYDFFTTYAAVDNWSFDYAQDNKNGKLEDPLQPRRAELVSASPAENSQDSQEKGVPKQVRDDVGEKALDGTLQNPLDVWAVSRLHQLQQHVTKHMDDYNIPEALSDVLPFLDDASNWYVRRSRRRFWKSGDDADKQQAYKTLHYVLLQLSILLAPFVPFLAEELFLKLTGGELGESVHLLDWPAAGHVNELSITEMGRVRDAINQGLSQRAASGIKVRQPLSQVKVFGLADAKPGLVDIIKEELNVKQVVLIPKSSKVNPTDNSIEVFEKTEGSSLNSDVRVELDTSITDVLKREGLMREVVRNIQQARKSAGLQVDDRIALELYTEDEELKQAIDEHRETIVAETLATSLETSGQAIAEGYREDVRVDGAQLALALHKA